MAEIVSLKPHSKKSDLCVLVFSDGSEVVFYTDVAVMFRLSQGTVSEQVLREATAEQNKRAALADALRRVSMRRMTEKETADYLTKKGYGEDVAAYALNKLKEYGYSGDAQYAESYANAHSNTKGNRAVKFALRQKGLSDELIDPVLKSDEDEAETCVLAARKFAKNRDLSDAKERTRLMRHLAYRGFGYTAISHALKTLALPPETFGDSE